MMLRLIEPMIDQTNDITEVEGEASSRKCLLFSRGNVQFGILESEIVAIEPWRVPAPLPNAPASVLGVVGIQGRMLTVFDLAKIADANAAWENSEDMEDKQILALRGDEQLALVADALGEVIEIPNGTSRGDETPEIATDFRNGDLQFKLVDPKQLFSRAIQGKERRRRRF